MVTNAQIRSWCNHMKTRCGDWDRWNWTKKQLRSALKGVNEDNDILLRRLDEATAKQAERCKLDGHLNLLYWPNGEPVAGEHNGTEIKRCYFCGVDAKDQETETHG